MQIDETECRKAFEEWFEKKHFNPAATIGGKPFSIVNTCWEAWQAARATTPAETVPISDQMINKAFDVYKINYNEAFASDWKWEKHFYGFQKACVFLSSSTERESGSPLAARAAADFLNRLSEILSPVEQLRDMGVLAKEHADNLLRLGPDGVPLSQIEDVKL